MSELDSVKQQVEAARNEVSSSKVASEQAQQVAADKMNEFAGLGLEGVAQVLNAVADALSTAVGQLASAYAMTDEAVSGLSQVSDGSQISATVVALNAAGQKLGNAGTEVQGAASHAEAALTHAQQSEVEPVVNAAANAVNVVSQTQTVLATAASKAGEHAQKVEESAKGLIASSSGTGDGDVGQVPPSSREPIAKIGDKLEEPQLGPEKTDPFKAELNNSDDEDKSKTKSAKLGRGLVRNATSLDKSVKDVSTSAAKSVKDDFDPYDYSQAQATVGVAQPTPSISAADKPSTFVDGFGTAVIMTVVAVEGLTRIGRRDKNG